MGYLDNEYGALMGTASDSPLEEYQLFSSSEINSLTSFNRSCLTVPGIMTDDHGLEGLDVGPSQFATLGLVISTAQYGHLSNSRMVIDMQFCFRLFMVQRIRLDKESLDQTFVPEPGPNPLA